MNRCESLTGTSVIMSNRMLLTTRSVGAATSSAVMVPPAPSGLVKDKES